MNPIIALQNHTVMLLPTKAARDTVLGAALGAVAGGLIGCSAGNMVLGILFGACLFTFAMRPRIGAFKSGD